MMTREYLQQKAMERIELYHGDITRLEVDAIVNAANSTLLGGGGVDGAIHRAAGPELLVACRALGGCPTGEARLTPGYRLPARWVIHTVGPVWHGGHGREAELLASAYRSSLEIARDHQMKSIAFPNISTGVYGFPKNQAALVAIRTVRKFLTENQWPEKVIFVLFDQENLGIYQETLRED
jgi:O-acetyl-ADP-ribose deacetylase (regulator of RNase III)